MGKQVTTGQATPATPSQEVSATGDTTTASATDVQVNGMTITPISGRYKVWFSGAVNHSSNGGSSEMSIYAAGVKNDPSERRMKRGAGQGDVTTAFCCMAEVEVNGSQAIEGRWRTSGATATMHERTLSVLKVG
jgi:hypothetical protein